MSGQREATGREVELRGEIAAARIVVERGGMLSVDVALHFAAAVERVLDLCVDEGDGYEAVYKSAVRAALLGES